MTKEIKKNGLDAALKALNGDLLEGLDHEQVRRLFQRAAESKAITQILEAAKITNIDIEKEIKDFLSTRKSPHTRTAYKQALNKWLVYCEANRIDPRAPGTKDADLYAASCRESMKASTANINIDGVSSFYHFMQKHHLRPTPFNGIERAKGPRQAANIPTAGEIATIKTAIPEHYHLAIDTMAMRGFRVGALKALHVKPDETFCTFSKGKNWTGHLPEGLLLPAGYPFRDMRAGSLQKAVQRACIALHAAQKISAVFSVHDLRHFYACNEYRKDRDIYRLKVLLNHDNIAITEKYLKGLNLF
jgi:site-specific recombinase XerD